MERLNKFARQETPTGESMRRFGMALQAMTEGSPKEAQRNEKKQRGGRQQELKPAGKNE